MAPTKLFLRVCIDDASGSAEKTRCVSQGMCKSTSNFIIIVTWYNVRPAIESFTVTTPCPEKRPRPL